MDFLHDFLNFSFPKRFIYLRGIALVVLIAETFERQGVLFILLTSIAHSCFTSSIFAARTLDFKVKFGFVFRSEAVVFRRYVLALLSVGLLRKFEAYLVYLSLIRSYFLRCFSFFQNSSIFTYMLLWFRLIIPSFPAQIDDMRSRFSALSIFDRFKMVPFPFTSQRYYQFSRFILQYNKMHHIFCYCIYFFSFL